MQIENANILITGASSGIGEACAAYFAKHKANLILCARRQERLEKLAHEIKENYSVAVLPVILDVTDSDAVEKALGELPLPWSDIDVVINNAGLAAGLDKVQEGSLTDWQQMIDTNIKGLLYVTRKILPAMIKRNKGHIINIGSIAGHEVYSGGAVYCATKHAVDAISRALRLDIVGTNIRVTQISPGLVETEFSLVRFKGEDQKAKQPYRGMQPLSGADVADAVGYCVSRPAHININEIIITPTAQASATVVHRNE